MASETQNTLAQSASLTGSTLHTGENVTLTLHPAPPGHGFKFRRKDLPDEPIIEAKVENVKMVERATTLVEGNVKIHTVEHVLSALVGMGVDNALIEMDSNEPPIGDGSALLYVELIKKAGIQKQAAPRAKFDITELIFQESKEGSLITLAPYDGFRISCTQAGPNGRFSQFLDLKITPEVYEKEIAPARTFVFYEDVKPLMDKGLIRGGSLENAIVIRDNSVMSKEPMRFEDEFVRHKILDIIGDLALSGRRINGHVIAVRPGHGPNTEIARLIVKKHAQTTVAAPVVSDISANAASLDTIQVMKVLPHRYPFLMVDRIIELTDDLKAVGVKSV
ncbi:MAG: UDP-3-O-acyl-N-acetylglucosamine deacetylase, partial [Chthoniobacterales bacterium]